MLTDSIYMNNKELETSYRAAELFEQVKDQYSALEQIKILQMSDLEIIAFCQS